MFHELTPFTGTQEGLFDALSKLTLKKKPDPSMLQSAWQDMHKIAVVLKSTYSNQNWVKARGSVPTLTISSEGILPTLAIDGQLPKDIRRAVIRMTNKITFGIWSMKQAIPIIQ